MLIYNITINPQSQYFKAPCGRRKGAKKSLIFRHFQSAGRARLFFAVFLRFSEQTLVFRRISGVVPVTQSAVYILHKIPAFAAFYLGFIHYFGRKRIFVLPLVAVHRKKRRFCGAVCPPVLMCIMHKFAAAFLCFRHFSQKFSTTLQFVLKMQKIRVKRAFLP